MANRNERLRTGIRWLLSLAVVGFIISDWGADEERVKSQPSEEPGTSPGFQITSIGEADVSPGDALVVEYEGADVQRPVEGTISGRAAEILVRNPTSVVVRISSETPTGKAGLRLLQGDMRTKAWDLQIRPNKHRKLLTRLFGGLALFVYGLALLARGLRGLAGSRVRTLLGRWTRTAPQAVGVGVLVGGVTQLTTSAAALAVGLVDARLLALGPTIAIFVGAQLGAALTGALLPVALASESLLVITIGVVWTRLAAGRRGASIARVLLGAGLMLYGLHLLQTAVQPLVSDPKILPYISYLRDGGGASLAMCAVVGALIALVLQGPGPVYILVIGLSQTGVIPLANAFAILAGTNLGASIGMALISWQSGKLTHPITVPHLGFGVFATVFALATIPLWIAISPDIAALAYGERVVRPDVSRYLGLGFAVTELGAVGLWLLVLPRLTRRALRRPAPVALTGPPDALAISTQRELATVLLAHQRALDGALEMSCTSDRARGAAVEGSMLDARRTLERQYGVVASASTELERTTQTVITMLQLQRQIEQLVTVAELAIERGYRLSGDGEVRLRKMHALASESYAAAFETMEHGRAIDLEAAGGREIHMNLIEAESRRVPLPHSRGRDSGVFAFGLADLIDTYEHVGNHLFRVCKTMALDTEELA